MKCFFSVAFVVFALASSVYAGEQVVIDTLIFEAIGEGFDGMVEVAIVIRNRARERKQSFEEVVKAPYQFSCWNKGAVRHKYRQKDYDLAKKAWEYSAVAKNDGANLYHAYYVVPNWDWSKCKFIKKVGKHYFYKERR